MTTRTLSLVPLALLVAGTLSCSNSPTEPPPGGGGVVLEPNPDGVLLEGEASAPAREALEPLPPSAADAADVHEGFIATRLVAALAPGATVAAVNAALEAADARIVSMNAGTPFVTLKIPAVADAAAAQAVGNALRASGAFTYAAPAHAAGRDEPSAAGRAGAGGGGQALAHLERSRFIAAWNVRALAADRDETITVLVPDEYTSTLPHDEIDAQSFTGFGSPLPLPGPVVYPGNNGFVVCGVVGANVDETAPTGTNPYPADLLDIQSIAIGGFTWTDIFWTLAYRVASSGDRFVLNTGIGYGDPDYLTYSKLDRAMHVLAWRIAASLHYQKFVHVAAAGASEGDPDLSSPFVAAARFDDVREMVAPGELSPADSLALETAWQDVLDAFPPASAIANNVLVVGAADANGAVLDGAAPGDLLALGRDVVGPCTSADPGGGLLCDGSVAAYSGSGVAAAQVSGLAAYLMNLADASPATVRSIIASTQAQSSTGLIDAYDAVLRLDGGPVGAVREALLDVAGFESDESDGDFDEYDLPLLADLAGGFRGSEADPFIRRLDLNGDGIVGGQSTARVDLDGDGSYSVVQDTEGGNLTFDEQAVTDFDVVCYYAYSDLYSGDPDIRANLLVPAHAGIFVEILEFPSRIPAGEPIELSVRAGLASGRGGGPEGLISISIEVDDGEADPSSGEIEPGTTFTTMVTLDDYRNELFIEAWAELGDEEVSDTVSALRFDEVELVARYVFAGTEVFSVFNEDIGIPAETIVDVHDYESLETLELIDESYQSSGSGTGAGMQVSGNASAELVSNLDMGSGTNFFGTTLEGSCDGSITLTNPNTDILSYQAQAGGWVEVDIEFNVWGTPAPFTLSGSVSGQDYYVELDGDEDVFVCDSYSDPCATISTGGMLAPGSYDLEFYIGGEGYIHSSGQGAPTQGTVSEEGEIDVTFSVNHNGVRLPATASLAAAPVRTAVSEAPIAREIRRAVRRGSEDRRGR